MVHVADIGDIDRLHLHSTLTTLQYHMQNVLPLGSRGILSEATEGTSYPAAFASMDHDHCTVSLARVNIRLPPIPFI